MIDHFKRFIKLLNEHDVKYIILGGQAVIFWGHIRYTGDMDIIIEPSPENAEKLILALLHFGYDVYDFRTEDFTDPESTIQLGVEPDRIDILCSTKGITFEECFQNKVVVKIEDTSYNFINLDDLLKNKKAVGRPKDIEDINNLTSGSETPTDES
jgi:predicted nucleotidyltransferase